MKSTKRILSAILSVVMILGCLTVGFTAQASGADLQEEINAAIAAGIDVDWEGGNVTLADTLVINGDVDVDFNGAVITGPAGKVAIQVDGGKVRLYDGVVLADQGKFSGETQFIKTLMSYKPAININDGEVELNCITAVGSLLRIPNSGTIEVPIGNGINANGGNVTIDNVIAIGMKALDNTNAKVVVKDAILAGIYKAVNIYNKVDFGKDYVQYETVELLEGFLKDGVNLSANEKKYIASATNSQGDFSVGSVIVNVAKPNFNVPTATTFVNGKLNIFADVEKHEHNGVSNRYSYSYTPDYAETETEIKGEKVKVKVPFGTDGGAQYVASFDAEAGEEYEVTVNYDLSIKLGKKQKEIVEKAFSILQHYIAKAPELLNRFVVDFEHIYNTAEELVALVYNAYFGTGSEFDKEITAELKDIDCIDDIIALIYALEGQEFAGSDETGILNNYLYNSFYRFLKGTYLTTDYSKTEAEVTKKISEHKDSLVNTYGAIFDTDGKDGPDSVFAYFNDNTFEKAATFNESEFRKGAPGYGSGKGLLDVFKEYYNNVLDKLYVKGSTTEFAENGVANAAKYIGENWRGIYELVENAVVVLDKANELLDSGAFEKVLGLIGKSSFASYINAFDTAYKYVNKVMDRVEIALDSKFVTTYLKDAETAGKYCSTYAKKVWNIANNPETYFDIDVTGDYVVVDLADEALNKTFKVKAEEQVKAVYVKVQVVGFGSAIINGVEIDTPAYSDEIWFDLGEEITVTPVGNEELGTKFAYMTVDNGGSQLVVGEDFSTLAATNLLITVVFQEEESSFTDVVFMTDKALNYKYIDAIEYYSGDNWKFSLNKTPVVAPDFAKMEQRGWSLDKDAEQGEPLENFADEVEAAAEAGKAVLILYAIYDYEENTTVGEHGETVKFITEPYVKGDRVYFELSIQLRGEKKALEAGVILTTIKDDAAMTVDKSVENSGYVFSRTSLKDADGYVLSDALHTVGVKSSNTIYARGYVIWEDGSVTYTRNVVSGTVTAA